MCSLQVALHRARRHYVRKTLLLCDAYISRVFRAPKMEMLGENESLLSNVLISCAMWCGVPRDTGNRPFVIDGTGWLTFLFEPRTRLQLRPIATLHARCA